MSMLFLHNLYATLQITSSEYSVQNIKLLHYADRRPPFALDLLRA